MAQEEIVWQIKLLADKFLAGSKQVASSTQEMADRFADAGRVLRASGKDWTQFHENVSKGTITLNTFGARFSFWMRDMTQGAKGFRMELLGVMFFGMQMSMLFGGMFQPAMEMFGIFDLWQQTLGVLFLPIVSAIFPYLLDMMMWFMELPEPVKLAIGAIAGIGFVIGKLLFTMASLGIGLGALFDIAKLRNMAAAIADMSKSTGKLSDNLNNLGAFGKTVSVLIGVALTYYWFKSTSELFTDLKTSWNERLTNIFQATAAGAAYGLVFGPKGALIGATIGFGISLSLNILDFVFEKNPQLARDWKKSWLAMKDMLGFDISEELKENGLMMLDNGKIVNDWSSEVTHAFYNGGSAVQELRYTYENGMKNIRDVTLTTGDEIVLNTEDSYKHMQESISETLSKSGNSWDLYAENIKANTESIKKSLTTIMTASGNYGAYDSYKLEGIYSRIPTGGSALGGVPMIGGKLASGSGTASDPYTVNDFLVRPGQRPLRINPNDTVMGFKGNMPVGSGATINQTINVTASNKAEIERIIRDNNSKLVNDFKRLSITR